jgi:putative ABC transport system permease protein
MRTLRVLVQRIRGLWQQDRIDADLHKEIADHLEEATEEYLKEGLSPAAARRAARISFGNVTQTEEAYREGRSLVWLERFARDARHALRSLWKQPALTVAVVGSLALGIGANAAIFSLLNGLLLKSLPVAQADRLVQITPGGSFGAWTYPLWQELRDRQDVLDGVFAWSTQGTAFDLSTGGSVDVANGLWVSGSFFDVLGVQPAIGRTLVPSDDTRGGGPEGLVAVISHRFWQRRFAGAADVVGRTISIERVPFRIVGVTAAGFVGPNVGSAFDVAIPLGAQPIVLRRDRLDQRNWWWLNVMGRLKPGQTTEAATAGLARLQPTLRDLTRPASMTPGEASSYLNTPVAVMPAPGGPSSFRETYREALTALMGIVGLVLLIACVNVANLLLARAERQRATLSLRLALGASRLGLIRQSLLESLVLSTLGALVGLAMAHWGGQWLVAQLPSTGGRAFLDVSLDWRVLGFTTALATVVAILFGTAPALHATRVDPMDALRGHRGTSGSRQGLAGNVLVAIQFALCLVLVVASGLFVRTFTSLIGRDSGIDRDRVLLVSIDVRHSPQGSPERGLALYQRLVEAVHALPGVSEVSFSAVTPVSNNEWDTTIENPRGLSLEEQDRRVYKNEISPGWFRTYGVPMVSGRDFRGQDQRRPQAVAIVNEAIARR